MPCSWDCLLPVGGGVGADLGLRVVALIELAAGRLLLDDVAVFRVERALVEVVLMDMAL
jgi:hypothetical protein